MALPSVFRKHPDEIVAVTCDLTFRLALGESISSASAAVVAPATITVGASPSIASPLVTATVSGGTTGTTDSFEIIAVTNSGEHLVAIVDIICDNRNF